MTKKDLKDRPFFLEWVEPHSNRIFAAGIAFYDDTRKEFKLEIYEEPKEKQYYLRTVDSLDDQSLYVMELAVVNDGGKFERREVVGEGFLTHQTDGRIYIQYGSKYKDLILKLKEEVVDAA